MDTHTLRPRQFRMINTGLQQSLGTVHPSQGTTQVVPQPLASFMDAVGQISFSMSPHLFHRVQFRCIARESINMQTRLLGQKRLDIPAPVDFAAIPDHEYMTPQMMQQLTQERNNLKASDIVSMEPRVKSQPPASGRNGQDADDRYFVPPVAVSQDRGLANGSPCPTDVGNQQKSTLVEKPQMGPKSFGLFLYVARPAPSTAGFHPRPAATPASQASGSSNSTPCATTSIRPQTCNELRTALGPISRSVSMSTTLWHARPPRHPSATSPADRSSVPASGDSDAPIGHALSIPSSLASDEFGSTGPHCSMTLSLFRPRRGKFSPSATNPMPGTDETPTVCMSHRVSCQKYSMYPLNVKDQ